MGTLIQTLLDITLLRKGPDAIPPSWLLFGAAVALRMLALALFVVAVDGFTLEIVKDDLVAWLAGLFCFGSILIAAGKGARLAPTLTALVGIGAIVTFAMLLVVVIGGVLFREQPVTTVAQLVLLWSVVVKGHIMARATGWHWYAGLLISIAVLVLQLFVGLTTGD